MVEASHDSAQLSAEIAALPEVLSTQGLVSFLLKHGQCSETDIRVQLLRICEKQGVPNIEGACWRIFGFPATHEFEIGVACDLRQLRKLRIFERPRVFTDLSRAKYPATPAETVTWDNVRRIIAEEKIASEAAGEAHQRDQEVRVKREETRRLAQMTWADFMLYGGPGLCLTYVGLTDQGNGMSREEAIRKLAEELQLESRIAANIIEDIQKQVQKKLRKAHTDDFLWSVGDNAHSRTENNRGRFGVATRPIEGEASGTTGGSTKKTIKVAKL